MAQSYDRRINLYINVDGKEIPNNVASIKSEMQKIINQQARMTIGSEEYRIATKKMQSLSGILKEHKENIGQLQTPLQKVTEFAKGLLPAFSFAAIAAGAKVAFDKVVGSTDFLSTKWEIFIGGMKAGTDEFFRTLATGDWSNFLTNMGEAVRVGREYADAMDRIEEKTRALRITEANSRAKELELEERLKNKGLSKEDRLKAGQERIKLEEDLAQKRVKVAQDAFDAELNVTMQQTRLSKERLMEVVSDMDSETKAKAQAYNDQYEIYQSAVKKNEQAKAGLSRAGISDSPFVKEMENSKAVLDSYPDSVKVYAEALRGVGTTTDEQLNKMVSAYEGLMTSQNSAAENTKRVRTLVNSLLAGKEEDGSKLEDQASKKRKEALETENDLALSVIESAYLEQKTFLISQYEGQETLQKEYHARMLANELAFILAKQELTTDDKTYLELQQQYTQTQNEYAQAITDMAIPMMQSRDEVSKFNDSLFEEAKLLGLATAKQNEAAIQTEELNKKTEKQRDLILDSAATLGQSLYTLASGGENAFEEAAKNMIMFALDVLKVQTEIAIAKATIESLTQPDSIITFGVSGMIRAAVIVGLIEAAFAGVKGLVNGAFSSKSSPKSSSKSGYADGGFVAGSNYIDTSKLTTTRALISGRSMDIEQNKVIKQLARSSNGMSSGGYTKSGGKYEAAGVVHAGEYVIPMEGVNNPHLRPVIDVIEQSRKNGSISNLSLNPVSEYSSGGYVSPIAFEIINGLNNRYNQVVVSPIAFESSKNNWQNNYASQNNTSTSKNSDPVIISSVLADPELKAAINKMNLAAAMLLNDGVRLDIVTIKKKLDMYENIVMKSGLGGFSSNKK